MERGERIGANIKRFRKLADLSKSELARRVKVSPTTVNNWEELGVIPRAEVLYDLSRALEVDLIYLMGRGTKQSGSQSEVERQFDQDGLTRAEKLDKFKAAIAELMEVNPENVQIIITT